MDLLQCSVNCISTWFPALQAVTQSMVQLKYVFRKHISVPLLHHLFTVLWPVITTSLVTKSNGWIATSVKYCIHSGPITVQSPLQTATAHLHLLVFSSTSFIFHLQHKLTWLIWPIYWLCYLPHLVISMTETFFMELSLLTKAKEQFLMHVLGLI
jgi:hypothetical protein